jgi:hypothetical protein
MPGKPALVGIERSVHVTMGEQGEMTEGLHSGRVFGTLCHDANGWNEDGTRMGFVWTRGAGVVSYLYTLSFAGSYRFILMVDSRR